MRYLPLLLITALLLGMAPRAGAQSADDPDSGTITKVATTSGQFLKLGVGARAISLGGSYVARADGLSALYWNPAGLAHLGGTAVQLAYTSYLNDVNYDFAAVGVDLGAAGTLGAALTYLDSGDMLVRTEVQPEGTGEQFSMQNFALQLTYGRALTDRFSLGASMKYINERIWHSSASTIAFDVGVLFTTPYERLRLGASMANFGPKMQMKGRDILSSDDPDENEDGTNNIVNSLYETDHFPLPLLFRVGLAWHAVQTAEHRIVLSADAAHPNDNSEYLNTGIEYVFHDLVALRVGLRNVYEQDGEEGLTFGGGLNLRAGRALRAKIDYAYADFGRLGQTHWFTLGLHF